VEVHLQNTVIFNFCRYFLFIMSVLSGFTAAVLFGTSTIPDWMNLFYDKNRNISTVFSQPLPVWHLHDPSKHPRMFWKLERMCLIKSGFFSIMGLWWRESDKSRFFHTFLQESGGRH